MAPNMVSGTRRSGRVIAGAGAVVLGLALTASVAASDNPESTTPRAWATGDLNTHTLVSDRSNAQAEVVDKALTTFGPDWMPNSADSGNPLLDGLMGPNDPTEVYADLWFYSNPIFVTAH